MVHGVGPMVTVKSDSVTVGGKKLNTAVKFEFAMLPE